MNNALSIPFGNLLARCALPIDIFGGCSEATLNTLNNLLFITEYSVEGCGDNILVHYGLSLSEGNELCLSFPGMSGMGLVLKKLAGLDIHYGQNINIFFSLGEIAFRLPNNLLPPMEKKGDKWEKADGYRDVEINLKGNLTNALFVLRYDSDEGFDFQCNFSDRNSPFNFEDYVKGIICSCKEVGIGNTGMVLEFNDLSVMFNRDNRGISCDKICLHLPPDLPSLIPDDLIISDCFIGKKGFSGKIQGEWDLEYKKDNAQGEKFEGKLATGLFGLEGGLQKFAIEFKENIPVATDIQGMMVLPFFDEAVQVELSLSQTGDFSVIVKGVGPDGTLELTKDDLFKMKVQSLSLERNEEENEISLEVSGAIQPLFYSNEGVTWPEASVEGLKVGYKNDELFVDIKGGWIDFKDQAVLDLYGFKAELNKIGFGKEGEKLWVGATGSMRLVELLPIGASVKGLRVLWNPNLPIEQIPTSLEFDLKGIEILHTIPQTMEFKGSAYFLNEGTIKGFGGDLYLNLPTVGFSAEAGMLVGINLENPPYPFFYIYLGVELPSGIPLGQSGLALKGAKGLFGFNVFPKITEDENWYYDWYKRDPEVGVTHSTKWYPRRYGLAFGAGITLTTTDGYIKGIKALLAFMLPGPVIIIEGRSLILAGLQPNAEPPFRMMAILDGNRGTIQLNVEAQAELVEDVLEAYGGLEAFFNFNDITLWHLYLGQDEPEDRRIQANLLDLFKANAYLMLDNDKMQMGAFIGIKKEFEYGLKNVPVVDKLTVKIDLNAWIEGKATLGWRPEQAEGKLAMEAGIGVKIPILSLHIGAGAEVHNKGPNPFVVDALVKVDVDLPAPIPDFKTELDFHWEEPLPPPVDAPLAEISIGNDMESRGYALIAYPDEKHVFFVIREPDGDNGYKKCAENSPVVPLDARPLIEFTHPVNDKTNCFFRDTGGTGLSYLVGKFRFTSALIQVQIYEHKKKDPWMGDVEQDWKLVYTSDKVDEDSIENDVENLKGVWLADNEPTDTSTPGARRLRLWTKSPFVHTHHSSFQGMEVLEQLNSIYYKDYLLGGIDLSTDSNQPILGVPRTNYTQVFLEGYPNFGTSMVEEAMPHCVDFNSVTEGEKPEGIELNGFLFTGTGLQIKKLYSRQTSLSFSCPECPKPKSSLTGMPLKVKTDDPLNFKNEVISFWKSGDTKSLFDYLQEAERSASLTALAYSNLYIEFPTPAAEIFLIFYENCPLKDYQVDIFRGKTGKEYSDDMDGWIREATVLQKQWEETEKKLSGKNSMKNDGKEDKEEVTTDEEKRKFENRQRGIERQIKAHYETEPKWAENVKIHLGELKSEKKGNTTVVTIKPEDDQPIKGIMLKRECLLIKICYIDAEEKEREDDQRTQCETNGEALPKKEETLIPGSYYRIVAKSSVDVELLDLGLPEDVEAIIRPLYNKIIREMKTTALFTHDAFFQTAGPPAKLEPYVLWTNPQDGENPVFCSYDLAIRFNRSYIGRMFENDEHKLVAGIYDTNGRLHVDGIIDVSFQHKTEASANPPFLFPYEQDWQTYAERKGIACVEDCFHEGDDWLRIPVTQSLTPQTIYELRIFGGEGGPELLHEDFRQPGFDEKKQQNSIIIVDQGRQEGPSKWIIEDSENGILKQKSNINNRDGDNTAYGTVILFGNENWTDYQLIVDVKTGSEENEEQNAIGVVFHYQNIDGKESYYRFSMRMHPHDKSKYYRKLVRVYSDNIPETVVGIDSKTGEKIKAVQKIYTKAKSKFVFDTSAYEEKFKKILSAEKGLISEVSAEKIKKIFHMTFAETGDEENGIRMENDWKPYKFDQWYRLRIEVRNMEQMDEQNRITGGVHIKVFLDSDLIFDLIDPFRESDTDESPKFQPIRSGKVGLYCWGNQNASFRNLMVKDAVLLKLNFITSKFNSFKDLIESSLDKTNNSTASYTPVEVKSINIDTINLETIGNCAAARYKIQCCEKEYKRKAILREDIEKVKRSFDEACLALDEEFAKLVGNLTFDETTENGELKLTQLQFSPLPETLKIYRLVNRSQETTGFFLRSPEPIDWKEEIVIGENPLDSVKKDIGRVSLNISTSDNSLEVKDQAVNVVSKKTSQKGSEPESMKGTENIISHRSDVRKAGYTGKSKLRQMVTRKSEEGLLIYNSDKTQAIFLLKERNSNDHIFTFSFEMDPDVDCPESILQIHTDTELAEVIYTI